ncbi:MAG: hypothetical protein ACQCN4_01985 [Candidatus Bathyarchaeia archaeon]|jgi:hypothetical protein
MTDAISTVIGELKTLSPDITHAVAFKTNGEALAGSEGTTPEQTRAIIDNITSITHVACIGGIERIVIQDINTQLAVSTIEDVYLATLCSRNGDQKIIKALTEVVVPTVVRLSLLTKSLPDKKSTASTETAESPSNPPVLAVHTEPETPSTTQTETPLKIEPFLPKAPTSQLMVEKIGGLLVPSDTVRIDGEVIERWRDIYDGKQLNAVILETLEGKTVTCKVKPLKDSRANARGIVQVPERLMSALNIDKGQLVMVSPSVKED